MPKRNMKSCSTLPIIRELKNKTMPVQKTTMEKKKINASEDRKKTQPLYTFGGNVKEVSLNS